MIMKKLTLFLSLFAMSLFVVACGGTSNTNDTPDNNDQVVEDNNDGATNDSNATDDNGGEDQTNDDTTGTNNDGTDGTNNDDTNSNNTDAGKTDIGDADEVAKMNNLDYIDFELQVEYAGHKEYEAELELSHDNRVKAEIEDDLNGVKTKGSQAFDELYPLVEQLTITSSTPKEEAIQEILKVFNLESNYEQFEAEIKFKDGTKIEFEDRK